MPASGAPDDRPFPPGSYPLVIVGSGPGGLQLSYCLTRLGVDHAVISADEGPGGMFRKWPLFQRLLSWTKPYAPAEHDSRYYERYDWNSLLADEPDKRGLQVKHMDGTSYFPSRPEMEANLVDFAETAEVKVRYGCRWEATRKDGDDFILTTSEGEYRCHNAVFAVGVAEPWRPSAPGIDQVPHYGEMKNAEAYAGKSVFIVGKKNSAFEIANGLLPWAKRIVLGSPSPAKMSVEVRNLTGVRARYVQPFEDHVLAGGVFVVDAAIQEVSRRGHGYNVHTKLTASGDELDFACDEVIAATGFVAPLLDLPDLGVSTFGQSRLPQQGPYWECPMVQGVFFAGTLSQGAGGLKKHGIPSNSGAVHGARYNARVLAEHIAETRFGKKIERPELTPDEVVPFLLDEVTRGPELWHQRSYLARVVTFDGSPRNHGIVPLQEFVDAGGPDAVAVTVEANESAEMYPAVYVRHAGKIKENLLDPHPLHEFSGEPYRHALASTLKAVLKHG